MDKEKVLVIFDKGKNVCKDIGKRKYYLGKLKDILYWVKCVEVKLDRCEVGELVELVLYCFFEFLR